MDNRNKNKNRRQKNKNKKSYSWKIINRLVESTSDQDSDGTTGSVGGERIRDSSQCSTTAELSKKSIDSIPNISDEKESSYATDVGQKNEKEIKSQKIVSQNGEKKKKRGKNDKKPNYIHKNNDKVNSVINALLVAALLIVSGLASGHYIASHSQTKLVSPSNPPPLRASTTILNHYVNKTKQMYQKLLDENKALREKIQILENNLEKHVTNNDENMRKMKIEDIEKDIIQGILKFIERETNDNINNYNNIDKKSINEIPNRNLKNNFQTITKDENEFNQMIEKGKLLQRRLKRKKFIKNENIAKNEKVKNNQENCNGNGAFLNEKERVKEILIDADHVTHTVCSEPNLSHEPKLDTNKYKINKNNGYVNNIRKIFEPDADSPSNMADNKQSKSIVTQNSKNETPIEKINENYPLIGTCSINDKPILKTSNELIGPKCYSEEFELESQYFNDTKADIRSSKRKIKNRSNEGTSRIRKKVKPSHDTNKTDEPNL